MRRNARVDANQREIVDALRNLGASVICLHMVGQGCPDLLVGFRGVNELAECKSKSGKLTPDEADLHRTWQGKQIWIVRSVDDCLVMLGLIGDTKV